MFIGKHYLLYAYCFHVHLVIFLPLCRTYQDLELCLSKQSTCPQIHLMAPYFARTYGEHMVQCPLPMPDRPEFDETTMEPSSKQDPTTDLMPMEEASISNRDLTEDSTKILTTTENSVTSATEVEGKGSPCSNLVKHP